MPFERVSTDYDTLTVRQEGSVPFAGINSRPMNLLGPELVRDLVSLIQRAEADLTSRCSCSSARTRTTSSRTWT